MFTTVALIELRGYDLLDILDDEIDALDSFVSEYEGSTYIGDAITEIADGMVPIYHREIWENAPRISEYIEEAIASGIAPVDRSNIDLVGIFQSGYYEYYTQSLYNNLDEMAFNYVANRVNNFITSLGNSSNKLDLEAIENEISSNTERFDNNKMFSHLDDIARDITTSIEDGDYDI